MPRPFDFPIDREFITNLVDSTIETDSRFKQSLVDYMCRSGLESQIRGDMRRAFGEALLSICDPQIKKDIELEIKDLYESKATEPGRFRDRILNTISVIVLMALAKQKEIAENQTASPSCADGS